MSDQQNEGAQDSQQEPTQDSGLQTPQADQPIPSGEPAEGAVDSADQGVDPAPEPLEVPPPAVSNDEQQAWQDQKEQDKEAAQREHAERTGGGDVREGELQAQRDLHNERTAGESSQND